MKEKHQNVLITLICLKTAFNVLIPLYENSNAIVTTTATLHDSHWYESALLFLILA